MSWFLLRLHYVLTMPVSILFILNSSRIHPHYRMTRLRKFMLGWQMFRNTMRIRTGTSYKTHLADRKSVV